MYGMSNNELVEINLINWHCFFFIIKFYIHNMDPSSEPLTVRLVVIGDGSVGKTCMLLRYNL